MATVLGLAAQIEREFVSQLTKEALAARKQAGMVLGRPPGPAARHKLDDREMEIRGLPDMITTTPTNVASSSPTDSYRLQTAAALQIADP